MNTRQMEIFVSIVRYGNFSNAAKKMYLSQPAVSANIDLLEKELGTKLFFRQGRKAELTEKGKIFYESAITILGLTEKIISDMNSENEIEGTIRLTSSFVPGLYLIPEYIKEFHLENAKVRFETFINNSKTALDGVLENKFDIGFIGNLVKNDSVLQKHIYTDKMLLVAPDIKPYSMMPKKLDAGTVKSLPFVMRTWGSSTLSIAESELNKIGIDIKDLDVASEFDSGEAVIRAIKLNMGVSILPAVCLKDNQELLSFEIEGVVMERDFYAVTLNNEYMPPKIEKFYNFLPDLDLK